MIKLLVLYVCSIFIVISTIGYGLCFQKIANFNFKNNNLGLAGIFGLFFLSILSSFSHIFFAHDYFHNIIIIFIGLFFSFFFIKKLNLKFFIELKYILIIFSLIFIFLIISKTNEDFPYYHLPNTIQFAQQKLQFGLGNLNHGFKHISSLFLLMSLNYLPYFEVYLFNLTNFLFYFFLILFCIKEIFLKKNQSLNSNISQIFLSLILILFLVKFSRLAEFGSDIAAQIVISLYIYFLFELFFNNKLDTKKKRLYYKALIILITFAITLKFILVIYSLLIIPILIIIKKKDFYNLIKSKSLIFCILSFLIFVFFNFSSTGCLIYPVVDSCLTNFSWTLPANVVEYMNFHYEIWSKGGKGPGFEVDNQDSYLNSFNWIYHWFEVYFIGKFTDYLLTCLLIVCTFSFFFIKDLNKKKIVNKIRTKNFYYIYFLIVIIFLFWFFNFPTLRYAGYLVVFLLIAFPFIAIINKKVDIQSKLSLKKLKIILIISFVIFFTKNITRLHKELNIDQNSNHNFVNFPFYWIDKTAYEKKYINNFMVYSTEGMCWDIPSVCVRGTEGIQIYKKNGYIFFNKK